MTSIEAASSWLITLLSGPLVTVLAAIAVAAVGYEMLSGRMAIRRGGMVIIGCFTLLGSAEIAGSIMDFGNRGTFAAISTYPTPIATGNLPPLGPEPPVRASTGNPFDPYAGQQPVQ